MKLEIKKIYNHYFLKNTFNIKLYKSRKNFCTQSLKESIVKEL
jgi:hypothetical protein